MKKGWSFAVLALCACAPAAQHFGVAAAPASAAPGKSFVMAQETPAASAVRAALIEAGLQGSAEGALRVEVGFSIRANRLAVNAVGANAGATQTLSPAGADTIGFCRRQAYVLTVALVDSHTGRVLKRSGATLSRCRGTAEQVLPILARAALPIAAS